MKNIPDLLQCKICSSPEVPDAFWGLSNSYCQNTGEESLCFLHAFQSTHAWSLLKRRCWFGWSHDLFYGSRFFTLLM